MLATLQSARCVAACRRQLHHAAASAARVGAVRTGVASRSVCTLPVGSGGDVVRRSQYFIPTSKEDFHDAAIPSHQLLLRAGFMRKSASGMFMLLPLAVRVIEKLTRVIDKEMTRAGAQKLSMPFLLSQELWQKTGRWDTAGGELMRLRDRHGKGFCLGPTHEEIFTELVAREVSSHKQLPLALYQIGTKFRDEVRPRFGLLRAREFTMKDAYSFHADAEDAQRMYDVMEDAYSAIFNQVGCEWVKVEADGGNIGSGQTHEFHILSDVGEDQLLHCPGCGYASNDEQAVSLLRPPHPAGDEQPIAPQGGGRRSARRVFLAPAELGAALESPSVEGPVPAGMRRRFVVVIGDDCDVNPQKVANAAGCDFELEVVSAEAFADVQLEELVDSTMTEAVGVATTNATVAVGSSAVVGDFRLAKAGELCACCPDAPPLQARRGIEVGQIFRLGTKYSDALGAVFTNAKGQRLPMEMGCYGIGVSRIVAAVVESLHDQAGIIWPDALAPFLAVVLTTGGQAHLKDAGEALASTLSGAGADVVLDDRWKDGFGFKLSEAELVGYPYVVIVGRDMHPETGSGRVEVRHRRTGEATLMTPPEVATFLAGQLELAQARPAGP